MKKTTQLKILWVFFLVLTLSSTSCQQLRSFSIIKNNPILAATQKDTKTFDNVGQPSNQNKPNTLNLKNIEYFISFLMGILTGMGVMFIYQKINEKYRTKSSNNNESDIQPNESKVDIPENALNHEQNISNQPTKINHPIVIPETSIPDNTRTPDFTTPSATTNLNTQTKLITEYNKNPKKVCKNTTEVSEAADSINQRRLGIHHSVILEKVSRGKGNYCIMPEQGFSYLLPKDNLKINEYNYETVRILFDCYNYQSSKSFQVKSPAIVVAENQDSWRLQKKGELQFF